MLMAKRSALTLLMLVPIATYALEPMTDQDLGGATGQAFFYTDTTPGTVATNAGLTFYRVGMDVDINTNLNVKNLKLGCDGAGGSGICDIDISNLRLTGVNPGPSGTYADSDALLRRPFLEFAIKDAGVQASREVVGFRMGAQEIMGRMGIGENPNTTLLTDDVGINRLSGDMVAKLDNVHIPLTVCSTGASSQSGPCNFASIAVNADGAVNNFTSATLEVNRGTQVTIAGIPTAATVDLGILGDFTINVSADMTEDLRMIHNLGIFTGSAASPSPRKDFYISVQKQNVVWQKFGNPTNAGFGQQTTAGNGDYNAIAMKGWWMSIPQVNIGDATNRIDTQRVYVGLGALTGATLANVELKQTPTDNCYGALTFC